MDEFARHPVTGALFESPVPPGTGWPGDPATSATPVAATAADVRRLSGSAEDVEELQARVSVCRACPRLVSWRESVARTGRRASFADQPYWGRPGTSFGDPDAQVLIVGLAPAANGTNRTGRMFTGDSSGDFLYAALHRTGWASQSTSVAAGDGQTLSGIRIVAAVRCAPPQNRRRANSPCDSPWASSARTAGGLKPTSRSVTANRSSVMMRLGGSLPGCRTASRRRSGSGRRRLRPVPSSRGLPRVCGGAPRVSLARRSALHVD